jgi:hypothetical protein
MPADSIVAPRTLFLQQEAPGSADGRRSIVTRNAEGRGRHRRLPRSRVVLARQLVGWSAVARS